MATTKIWAVHSRLDHLVDYVSNTDKTINPGFDDLSAVIEYAGNDYKTEQRFFVSGINCQPETAYAAMSTTLKMRDKALKVLGYHGYQSFAKGEVTAEAAHEIGVKLAQELWGEWFQVVVATHLNTDHFHNHFVLCVASFIDGKRFHACNASYALMREASDRLCREYALSVIDYPRRGRTKHYAEYKAEQDGRPTWRGLIKAEVDDIIRLSMTESQFFHNLKSRGHEVKTGKYLAVRPPGKERFFRLDRNFGDEYSLTGINKRILEQQKIIRPAPESVRRMKHYQLAGNLKKSKKLTGFRALYFHYLFLLGKIPKSRSPQLPKHVYFLYREDMIKLDKYSNEIKLLCRNRIDTSEQLYSYMEVAKSEIVVLTAERKLLRGMVRNMKGDDEIVIKSEISALSKRIGALRKEVGLCEDIMVHTAEMKAKMLAERESKAKSENRGYVTVRNRHLI